MKKTYMYPAIIRDDENDGLIADILGFGQHASGDTFEEVMESAGVVLDMCICEYLDTGKALPSPEDCLKAVSDEDKPNVTLVTVDVDTEAYAKVLWVGTKCIPNCESLLEEGDSRGIRINYALTPTANSVISELLDNIDIIALPYDISDSIKQRFVEIAGNKPVFLEVVNSETNTDAILGGFLRWDKLN